MTLLMELENTSERVAQELPEQLARLRGKRIHVVILSAETEIIEDEPRPLSITEKILARVREMPPEERDKLPVDLAEQHDHYIYGWPKK